MTDKQPLDQAPTSKAKAWARRILYIAVMIATFVAFKFGSLVVRDWYQSETAGDKLKEEIASIKAAATEKHPANSASDGIQMEAVERSNELLSRTAGTAKLVDAANQYMGYYVVNTRARVEYCKSEGVEIAPFVASFGRMNEDLYRRAGAILSRVGQRGLDLDPKLYNTLKPQLLDMVRLGIAESAKQNSVSNAEVCRWLAEFPDAAAANLALAQLNPMLNQIILNAAP